MNAKDLRIGNLTYRIDSTGKANDVIDSLIISDIERILNNNQGLFIYKQIKITDNILFDLGFEFFTDLGCWQNQTRISLIKTGDWYLIKIDDVIIREIEFVDDLQNVCYFTTNIELTQNQPIIKKT